MTDKKIIFTTGEIIYDKEWYRKSGIDVKPVRYTNQFLKEIASKTMGSSLELSHGNKSNDVVGYVNDFEFNDNDLVANITTNEDLKGMGFSPEFEVNFKDKGSYYEAFDGKLLKTILTDTPRSHILCNSVDGGSNMNEELIDTLNKQIKDLNRQVAQKEALIEANKKKLESYEELNKEIENLNSKVAELEKSNNDYKTQIEGLKPKAEAFSKIESDKKEEALTKAFGDDEEAKKAWRDDSLEKIEALANHREVTRQANGIGAGNAEGVGEGSGEEDEKPDVADEALAFYQKIHNGEKPSFLKEE